MRSLPVPLLQNPASPSLRTAQSWGRGGGRDDTGHTLWETPEASCSPPCAGGSREPPGPAAPTGCSGHGEGSRVVVVVVGVVGGVPIGFVGVGWGGFGVPRGKDMGYRPA